MKDITVEDTGLLLGIVPGNASLEFAGMLMAVGYWTLVSAKEPFLN
ncbi:MAG: hypothetical protein JNL64_04755 [Blastocatellia bacterium]|nr:hypothetical protein [Blastocatellia bacterium]